MTVIELAEKLSLKRLSKGEDREIASCYISDLLSRVLGSCKTGDVWITVQTSMNVIAVASMTGASCVILPEGLTTSQSVLDKASEENLFVFTSDDNAYNLAKKIALLI